MGKAHSPKPHGGAAAAPAPRAEPQDPPPPPGSVLVDGSLLEGGGQILRNAAAMSAITGRPVCISKIRAGRKNPGLSPQHLTGLRLVEAMCGGALAGGRPRSAQIALAPGRLFAGRYAADTGTAGSCTLMAQQALPCMLFAAAPAPAPSGAPDAAAVAAAAAGGSGELSPAAAAPAAAGGSLAEGWSELELRGGTDAAYAPPVGYLTHVLAPLLARLLPAACGLDIHVVRRGFYPRGGGAVAARARALAAGEALPPIDLTRRGALKEVRVHAFSAGRVPQSDAQRMAAAAVEALQEALRGGRRAVVHGAGGAGSSGPATIEPGGSRGGAADSSGGGGGGGGVTIVQDVVREGESTAAGDGCGLLLVAESDAGCLWGASALWERGVPPGAAGRGAAEELLEALEGGGCVDQWMQDQLIIYMALAKGTSRMVCGDLTLHTRTAMLVAEALLPGAAFSVKPLPPRGGGGGGGGGLHLVECRGAGWVAGAAAEGSPV
ncbi:MAG: RNA 3'-terminal phosphate cyclase [Monoraphidium minutum]|nr:MAG: RNA 3'-terminal phosphate cyclase [Monoraphidium minutum]